MAYLDKTTLGLDQSVDTLPVPSELPRFIAAYHWHDIGSVPLHVHDCAELVLVTEGHVQIELEGETIDGPIGSLYVLPAKIPHAQLSKGEWRTRCVLMSWDDAAFVNRARVLPTRAGEQARRWMNDLYDLSRDPTAVSAPVLDCLLASLLWTLRQDEVRTRAEQELHPSLVLAQRFLEEHVTKPLDRQALANASCTSPSYLGALFKQEFGCGPMQYQQRLRLRLAQSLLMNPYLGVEEVAEQCGYPDAGYFSRLFRRAYGLPPHHWRSVSR